MARMKKSQMKKSQQVTIALVAATAAAGIGVSAWSAERDKPDCVDQKTGAKVDDDYCESSYHYGHLGRYNMIYRNSDGTHSIVDAGDKTGIAARGGFGSSGYHGSSGG